MIVSYAAPPASAPEPRLTARSMLSLGTELFLAFWMASKSVGLPSGSPPPVRAATSMFLISLANILPRRASMTAFLCLVVAHLEWPLMMSSLVHRSPRSYRGAPRARGDGLRRRGGDRRPRPGGGSIVRPPLRRGRGLPHHRAEQRVHPQVPRDLRVERRGQHRPLPHRHRPARGGAGLRAGQGHPRDGAEHLDARTDRLHPRRPDEDRAHRPARDA